MSSERLELGEVSNIKAFGNLVLEEKGGRDRDGDLLSAQFGAHGPELLQDAQAGRAGVPDGKHLESVRMGSKEFAWLSGHRLEQFGTSVKGEDVGLGKSEFLQDHPLVFLPEYFRRQGVKETALQDLGGKKADGQDHGHEHPTQRRVPRDAGISPAILERAARWPARARQSGRLCSLRESMAEIPALGEPTGERAVEVVFLIRPM